MTAAEPPAPGAPPEVRAAAGRVRGSPSRRGGLPRHPVRRATGRRAALRRAPAGRGLGRRARGASPFGPPPPQGGHFGMDALSPGGGRRLADGQRVVARARPGRGPAGHGVDPGRRLRDRHVRPARVRRRPARAGGRRRRGDVQLPRRARGLRADRGGARPTAACSTRSPRWSGCATTSRAFGGDPGPGHRLRPVRGRGVGRRAARDAPGGRAVPPGRRAEHAGHLLLARARRGRRRRLRRGAGAAPHGGRPVGRRPAAAVRPPATPSAPTMEQRAARWGLPAHRRIPFSPVVDGEVLAATPWQALADGAGRDVELLVGHTRDEQRLFTVISGLLGEVGEEQAADRPRRVRPRPGRRPPLPRGLPGGRPGRALRAGALRLAVPDAVAAPRRGAGGRRRPGARLRADLAGAGDGRRLRRLPRPRRAARLRQPRPRPAGHADRRPAVDRRRRPCPAAMRAAWTSFAAHGDPGWPEYDTDTRLVQRFDARPEVTPTRRRPPA